MGAPRIISGQAGSKVLLTKPSQSRRAGITIRHFWRGLRFNEQRRSRY